jgi:uncharacterized protein YidB (DUF937 family)
MSILDTIAQKISGQPSVDSATEQALTGHLTDIVNHPDIGGVQGLVDKFHSNGLGDIARSWLSSETGQSISSDKIASVLGQDRLNTLASKLGMEPDRVSGLVAQYLPIVMSKLSGSQAARQA